MQTGYKLQSSGRCIAYITSMDECNKAAAALSLKDTTASSVSTETKPPGCYFFFAYTLKMNAASSTYPCSSNSECLCKLTTTLAPSATLVPTMTLAPTKTTGAPSTISPASSQAGATGAPTATGEWICSCMDDQFPAYLPN